ncbi:MAG: sulfotransferase [Candidatus Promineofilum sp.]|nr:sulfotransferase [Promineifilum sp.]
MAAGVPGAGLGVARAVARLRRRLAPPGHSIRLLEKTPENCLRLPFLQALFPDARVLFLVRDGRANVHSLLEGWRQPRPLSRLPHPRPRHQPRPDARPVGLHPHSRLARPGRPAAGGDLRPAVGGMQRRRARLRRHTGRAAGADGAL